MKIWINIDEDVDRDGLEIIDYVRTAYQEILKLEASRNGGVWQVI